jgi:hypothetical protein
MKRTLLLGLLATTLFSACASGGDSGSRTEAYGQISGGIETSRTR